jgi:transcriptional regulator with XRE-family HTH domain
VETVRSKSLGAALRELRESAQVKQDDACAQLGWSRSKLDRIEAGVNVIKPADLVAALDLYNADAETRGALEELRKDARSGRRGWWLTFADVFGTSLPALEHDANRIRNFETIVIPGLLQTADYAAALIASARPDADQDGIDKRVRARMARQDAVFLRSDVPAAHFLIYEAALLCPVGGPEVMRAQLSELWAMSRRPNVTVQIVPLDAGAHAGLEGPFMLLTFDNPKFPEVAFTESPGGHVYLEGATDLARISLAWDRLAQAALSPEDSARRCAELTRGE